MAVLVARTSEDAWLCAETLVEARFGPGIHPVMPLELQASEIGTYDLRWPSQSAQRGIDIEMSGIPEELVDSLVATLNLWGALPVIFGWSERGALRILPPGGNGAVIYVRSLVRDGEVLVAERRALDWNEVWAELPSDLPL